MKNAIIGFLVVLSVQLVAKEKFHVVVRDQDGLPVKGAAVMVRQKLPVSGLRFWSSDRYENFFGETDENGKSTITFSARTRHFEWGVGSEDYYSESESATVHFTYDEIVFNQDANDNNLERDWKASAKRGLGYCGPMAP